MLIKPLIAIDIGNTRVKMRIQHTQQSEQVILPDAETALRLLDQYPEAPVIISAVRPFSDAEQALIPAYARIMSAHTPLPLRVDYQTPHSLGTDRIAGACGAWNLFPNSTTLVIDLGTCINYELVTADGTYKGGAISPGLQMRFEAMHTFTGKLPLIQPPFSKKTFPGQSTRESLEVGVWNGIYAEMQQTFEFCQQTYKASQCILTGGDSIHFEKILKNNIFAHPELVLLGLVEILRYNLK